MEPLGALWAKTDAARERELYRYFEPPEIDKKGPEKATRHNLSVETNDDLTANPPSSPETTLTALAQLCALRLNASRAMVSVISKETQYFIAEATKTLDLVDNQIAEAPDDNLWVGCTSVDKSGRLCEKTVELPASSSNYPCFTVEDLSKDERFNQLPFVTGPPNFRFYAGTPLTTKNGINIGSLFVLDDRVRSRLTATQERFLGTIAATIMGHMEVNRDAKERRKVLRMAKGLNAFVEGKASFSTTDGHDGKLPSDPADNAIDEIETSCTNIESAHKATFSRAASLLSDSLDLRTQGGVCFLDTSMGPRNLAITRTESKGMDTESGSDATESPRKGSSQRRRNAENPDLGRPDEVPKTSRTAEVLSFSGLSNSSQPLFESLDDHFIQSLLKHYPRGKLWIFDDAEGLTSEEDNQLAPELKTTEEKRRRLHSRKISEKKTLRKHFSNVSELIFVPLWDAGSSRWFSGCFCWRTSKHGIFSVEAELQFVTAFGNSIVAEVSRLASIYESRQKGDFIGSISHELRSPLHGILASAEFLSETDFDAFQGNLVDTISSCGRTLLDTIEHILDFSKINSFERNWKRARKPRGGNRRSNNESAKRALAKDAPPLMSIFVVTDVAAIVEEVVEGVYAGQVYRDFGSADITDVSTGQRGATSNRGLVADGKSLLRGSAEQANLKTIEVILDIAHDDYSFAAQPGALRRVVMNIFGNALKYTLVGKIVIKLRLESPESTVEHRDKTKVLVITVTDTGRGISSDYLRSSLYTPFSQEDVLANGTGLGLSIVRSIITMLEGTINIESQVGQGTEVQMRIPLNREVGQDTPASTPSSVGSPSKLQDNSISLLQTDYPSRKISIYNSDDSEQTAENMSHTSRMARYYVEGWYNLAVETRPAENWTDVIIVEEKDLLDLLKRLHPGPAIVVLSNRMRNKHRLQAAQSLYPGAVEFLSTPFGPYKLAKAIKLSLEQASSIAAGHPPQPPSTVDSPRMVEDESILPEFGSVTLKTEDEATPIRVQSNGTVTASHTSNARMALGSGSSATSTETRGDFPFPAQSNDQSRNTSHQNLGEVLRQPSTRPKLSSRKTEPVLRYSFQHFTSTLTAQGALATSDARDTVEQVQSAAPTPKTELKEHSMQEAPTVDINAPPDEEEQRLPRLLLVDDNKINLRLLETFIRKRKYQFVDSAEDGKLAVEAAKRHPQGYDIIFMDLSMPVMNGFEATRELRRLEQTKGTNADLKKTKPAMIVALTGLASGRDHGEAFACGVDLYMTKPVSFKEVGRLLDNWEAHGGMDAGKTSTKE
ncbi:MAG: hypothetical protein Q9222_005771 [Ikaeria aurantiellina]